MTDITTTHHADSVAQARAQRDDWRARRLSSVTAPQGNLALVLTRWLADGETLTDEEALAGRASTVTVTHLERVNLDDGRPEQGIRLWDSASPAIEHFDTVTLFDFAPQWVIEAQFTPIASDRVIPFEHIRDNGLSRGLVVPGDITFTLDGEEHRLSAFDDGGVLLLVFGDATNGADTDDATYPAGRFLFVERPQGSAFDAAGPVLLDFNKAFVPPCGFSEQYNCPLPPKNNRFTQPVRAGEKRVVFRDGFDIH